jgi:hypothetical protein
VFSAGQPFAAHAEAELQRRTAQILGLSRQVEAAQAELRLLRNQSAAPGGTPQQMQLDGLRTEQARQLVPTVRLELEAAKDKLGKTQKVAKKLNAWFVENSVKMNIQDPAATPSAFLEQLLEGSHGRMEHLSTDIIRIEGSLEAAAAALQQQQQQQQQHPPPGPPQHAIPPGASADVSHAPPAVGSTQPAAPRLQLVPAAVQASQPSLQGQMLPTGLDHNIATAHMAPQPQLLPHTVSGGASVSCGLQGQPLTTQPVPVAPHPAVNLGLPMGMWVRDPDAG